MSEARSTAERPAARRFNGAPLIAGGVGLLWFLRLGGVRTLDVAQLDWLMDGDWAQHVLGWLFFRREPWALPLGKLTGSLYPVGTTVGFTDSNPLLSIGLKPFSGRLPMEMQFIGPWLAACFALNGMWGARLVALATPSRVLQVLGGSLFALSPVLTTRVGHDTLCAHFLLLALLHLNLRPMETPTSARRSLGAALGWLALSTAIHPYLAVMVWALTLALCVQLGRHAAQLRRAELIAWAAAGTAVMGGLFALLGYLGGPNTAAAGFGTYSADLLTLVNPMGSSRWLPPLPHGPEQYEGMGYLGLGALGLGGVALYGAWRRGLRPAPRTRTLILTCAALGVFALSWTLTLGGFHILGLRTVFAFAEPLVAPFRSSGRFIWPLHYLALTAAIFGTLALFRARSTAAAAALAGALLLQALEPKVAAGTFAAKPLQRLDLTPWAPAVDEGYRHLALYPPRVFDACEEEWNGAFVHRYMFHAYRVGLTFNSGYFARVPLRAARQACAEMKRAVEAGRLDPQTIYVVSPSTLPLFRRASAVCGQLDGEPVCVSKDAGAGFRERLSAL